jgi:hypothetical protein
MSDNLPATRGESAVATAEPSLPPATVAETPAPAVSGARLGPSSLTKPKTLPELAAKARKEIARKEAQALLAPRASSRGGSSMRR